MTFSICRSRWEPCITSYSTIPRAQGINQQYDLSTVGLGLLIEIFQAGDPVLVEVECQIHLLLLAESGRAPQGWRYLGHQSTGTGRPVAPDATVADFRGGAPRTAEACRTSPAAVTCFMPCTTLSRWSVTWRTRSTKPWTPGPSSSESKRPPNVVMASKDQSLARKLSWPGRLRPRRSHWLMRWGC